VIGILVHNNYSRSKLTLSYTAALFAGIGTAYFVWRWNYFGYPLPNPFYKKGGGELYFGSLIASFKHIAMLCLPFIPAYAVGLFGRKTARTTGAFLIPVAGFASMFVLLSEEMNFGWRFQYVCMPIILMSWYPLVEGIRARSVATFRHRIRLPGRIVVVLLAIAVVYGMLKYQKNVGYAGYTNDSRPEMGRMLARYSDKGNTIATTEAGQLPLFSRWRAIDAWGLNDQWITHYGGITFEYLDRYKPEIIMFHGYFAEPFVHPRGVGTWHDMVMVLKIYAEENHYILAAAFGETPHDTHHYYVRRDFVDSDEIVNKIRSMDYYWYGPKRKTKNYALFKIK
jgi:hypothetical protein